MRPLFILLTLITSILFSSRCPHEKEEAWFSYIWFLRNYCERWFQFWIGFNEGAAAAFLEDFFKISSFCYFVFQSNKNTYLSHR